MGKKTKYLSQIMLEVETVCKKLALHFSEDPSKFVLIDCFSIFSDLLEKIAVARKDNELRRKQVERKARLAAEREQQLKEGPSTKFGTRKTVVEEEVCVVDRLLSEIRRGEFKLNKSRQL